MWRLRETPDLEKCTRSALADANRVREIPGHSGLSTLRSTIVRRRKEAEEAVCLVAYSGGEEEPIAGSSGVVIAKAQRPQPVVLKRMSIGVTEEAIEVPTVDVINSDLSAPGIADQQVVAEEAEICRR